jgi:hypothetical protein
VNLHAKHVVDSEPCQRCSESTEDRYHTFFGCSVSAGVWQRLGLADVATLSDEDVWSFVPPTGLDARLWSFILLTILWRLWDARNGEIFRREHSDSRIVVNRVCDDVVIWGLFRSQILPQISLCKKKIPYHIKMPVKAWSTKCR